MSGMYGPADRAESIATIHAALDAGINLIDTGDLYGTGHNEMLIGEALRGIPRDKAVVSLKFGALRDPANGWGGYGARPAAVKSFLAYSLQRLGLDYIDIYRPARLDPAVPIEDTIGAITDLVKAGNVRAIGLSEMNAETIRRAAAVHPICDLEIEYSLISHGIDRQQPGPGGRNAQNRRGQGRQCCADRHRLGRRPGPRHCAAGRRPAARPPG
jgi:aryl-alcohol dehydrogenase-like predicted oxidoreductase